MSPTSSARSLLLGRAGRDRRRDGEWQRLAVELGGVEARAVGSVEDALGGTPGGARRRAAPRPRATKARCIESVPDLLDRSCPGHSWRRLVVPQPRRRRAKLARVTARVPIEPELAERDGEPSPQCAPRDPTAGASAPAELSAPSDEHDGHIDVLYAADTAAPDEPRISPLCSPFIRSGVFCVTSASPPTRHRSPKPATPPTTAPRSPPWPHTPR